MTSLAAIAFHGLPAPEVRQVADTITTILQHRIDRAVKRQRDAERKRRSRAAQRAAKLRAFERACAPAIHFSDGRVVRPIR